MREGIKERGAGRGGEGGSEEEEPRGRSLGAGQDDSSCLGVLGAGARWLFSCCNVCAFRVCALD